MTVFSGTSYNNSNLFPSRYQISVHLAVRDNKLKLVINSKVRTRPSNVMCKRKYLLHFIQYAGNRYDFIVAVVTVLLSFPWKLNENKIPPFLLAKHWLVSSPLSMYVCRLYHWYIRHGWQFSSEIRVTECADSNGENVPRIFNGLPEFSDF